MGFRFGQDREARNKKLAWNMKAPIPASEEDRIEALRACGILDTPAEGVYDDLVELATRICQTPMGAVSLVDCDRQWFKARVGIDAPQTARDNSFCAHGIVEENDLFIVKDARADERFSDIPLVQEDPNIHFYAGARLTNSEGHNLGMLCVMDRVPRELDERQKEALKILARQVVVQMDLQKQIRDDQASRHLLERRQQQLRESEALYQSLVEHLPLFVVRKDKAGRVTFANKLLCEALRKPLAQLMGRTDSEWLPRQTALKFRATDERVQTTGQVLVTVEEVALPLRSLIHLEITTAPLYDRLGEIVGVQVIMKDVSESHRLQLQLRKSREELENRVRTRTATLVAANDLLSKAERQSSEWKRRYDQVVASSGLAVYDIDRITGEVFWGNGAERVLGLNPEALNRASDQWLELVHPQDRVEVMRSTEAAITNGAPFDIQYRVLRPGDDHELWIKDRGFVVPDAQGRCVRVLGIMQNVTQRKLVEDTMREQAALLDHTQDAIMVRDLENHILYWNHTAEQLYGWSVGEALGKPVHQLLLQGNVGHLAEAQSVAMRQGAWSGEIKVYNKAGRQLTVNSRWTLLRNRDGKPHAFLVAHTDLTESKLLEEKFLRAQRLESIGALASGIAHDLNNVFTPILMSSQLLGDCADNAMRDRMLSVLKTSARRGSDMVKQVLSFTRGMGSEAGLVQVKHLIVEMARMMRDTFPRNIKIETNTPPELWVVRGDATQLYQVLMNLCINARDAMPNGGTLRVLAENLHMEGTTDARGNDRKSGPYVCVTVGDSGTGMSPQIQKKIFEPFFTTKEPGKGTGLGLSTVMSLVKGHGGFVELESQVNVGTQFKVLLPADEALAAEVEAANQKLIDGNGEWLLVVEDESSIREILKTTLEAHNYNVLMAEEGTEALSIYAEHRDKIALVITDLAMPVLDGFGTIRALRKMNTNIKWIAVTGMANAGASDQLPEGAATVLLKPYSPEKLLAAIHDALCPSPVSKTNSCVMDFRDENAA
jgi:PAS domain S-box-containing protein